MIDIRSAGRFWRPMSILVGIVLLTVTGMSVAYFSLGRTYTSSTGLVVLPSSAVSSPPTAADQSNPFRAISQGDVAAAQALVVSTQSSGFEELVDLDSDVSYSLILNTLDGVTARGGFLTLAVSAPSESDLSASREALVEAIGANWRRIQLAAGADPGSLIEVQDLGSTRASTTSAAALRATGAVLLVGALCFVMAASAIRRSFAGLPKHRGVRPQSDQPHAAAAVGTDRATESGDEDDRDLGFDRP